MTCTAKIRPFGHDGPELQCESTHDAESFGGAEHHADLRDYAYPGSVTTVHWLEVDRRTFRGEYKPCPLSGCVLPAFHRGGHAA